MFKSNNFESIIDDLSAFSQQESFEALRPTTFDLENTSDGEPITTESTAIRNNESPNLLSNDKPQMSGGPTAIQTTAATTSLASLQLTKGLMETFSPPLAKARTQLKELIGKQNKIYIDLSAEKYKLDNAEVAKLQDMVNDVKVYREKLLKIKKQMQNIYQRTKVLKKRALNVQTCKEKELQRKLQKQQQEESLIGKQQQQQLQQQHQQQQQEQ